MVLDQCLSIQSNGICVLQIHLLIIILSQLVYLFVSFNFLYMYGKSGESVA